MKRIFLSIIILAFFQKTNAQVQDTSLKIINLNEVVIGANKVMETKKTVAQQIQIISPKEIANSQAQTTADLIANTGTVAMQKSQQGGGSPVIRGFEANRVLLVVDGVRMNNIIYRSGHLQNIVTLDNNMLERAEILFGPSSTIYGSDALGGVIHLYSKNPLLANEGQKQNIKTNAFLRYGSVNNEMTGHLDFNIGGKKFGSLTSFTYSKFDDLRGGKNQNPFYTTSYGERPFYAERINGKDSLVKNQNPYLQKQSGYSQYDVLQKFLFRQNENVSHSLNVQFSNSSDVPRYDRLTDPDPNGINPFDYAQWYYGPQKRLLTAYHLKAKTFFFQNINFGINYQNIEESRHTRKFNSRDLSNRIEKVDVVGANLDFQKIIKAHKIRFGAEAQFNNLKSTAFKKDIITDSTATIDTRYPDGKNTMTTASLYLSHTWAINHELFLTSGVRAGISSLHSTFVDTAFFSLPYTEAKQNNTVYSGSIGLINTPSDDWKLSLMISTGFRVPNVDDMSKIFESAPGKMIVPNADLKPEKTINYELGVAKIFNGKAVWENSIYFTQFIDAIVADKFQFNGKDSVYYEGVLSEVFANQNKRKAYIYGFSSTLKAKFSEHFNLSLTLNYTYGRIKTDSSDYPLEHIPPLMSRFHLQYNNKKFSSEFFVNYNGWKQLKDYYLNGEDNEQYATPDGMPAWLTANIRASYKVNKYLTLQTGVDNIFDTQYRTFASGMNGAGRNVFVAVRVNY